ncbi:MAG: hypothetical protein PUA93_06365 [Eubacteriales bacterium]|nr:hypothetical protein [Eubacteriales bacterium]
MNDQIKMKQLIPDFVLLLTMGLLFGLMALPHSQYQLLGEIGSLSDGANTSPDLGILLPAVFTLFVILCGVATALFALLCLLLNSLYTFHFVNKVCAILGGITAVLELLYLFFGFGHELKDGTEIIQAGNIVTAVLFVTGFLVFLVLFLQLISKPFLAIKREMMNTPSSPSTPYHEEEKEEEAEPAEESRQEENEKTKSVTSPSLKSDASEKKLRQVILEEVASGKLSPEEAAVLLEKLGK